MKKYFLSLLLVAVFAIAPLVQAQSPVQEEMMTVRRYGFSFSYPKSWGTFQMKIYPAYPFEEEYGKELNDCKSTGFTWRGKFTKNKDISLGGQSSDYTVCLGGETGMFDIKNIKEKDGKLFIDGYEKNGETPVIVHTKNFLCYKMI